MSLCADINYLDYVWRIIIGFGAVPCVATIYLRSTLPETPRYTTDVHPQSPFESPETFLQGSSSAAQVCSCECKRASAS